MSAPQPSLEELTLRVAVLRIRMDQLKGLSNAARSDAERAYAGHRAAGNKQVTPVLPGGIEAGTVSIHAGQLNVVVDEAALLALVEESEPANAEDAVDPAAFADRRVLELVSAVFPEYKVRQVNPERRAELVEAAGETGGTLVNKSSGETVRVAEVWRGAPTGAFAYAPGAAGKAAILAALRDGTVTEDGYVVPAAAESRDAA